MLREAQLENPRILPNTNFKQDIFNVVIGLIWHTSLTASPIFLVIQYWPEFTISLGIALVTTVILKINWWDKLEESPCDTSSIATAKATAQPD